LNQLCQLLSAAEFIARSPEIIPTTMHLRVSYI